MAVTSNLAQFQLGIRRFEQRAEDKRRDIFRAVGMEALRGLVMGTRVDTGRARGNWQAAEGAPPSGAIERLDPTGQQAIGVEGRTVLAASGSAVLWLHNGVPYIGVLESKDKMLVGNVERLKAWLEAQR
jgi:hypothetical protein